MNRTNHNAELPPLKARCNQMGIHISTRNPAPAEIIPYVEQRLADHQKHFAKTMDPSCGYHIEWKSTNDDLINFLKELGAPQPAIWPPPVPPVDPASQTSSGNQQTIPSSKKSARSDSTVANQQPTGESKVTPGDSKVNPAASEANPTDSAVTPGASKPTSSDSQPKPLAPPAVEKPFDIREHLDAGSMRVCYDLQEYLSGRSPLDKLTPQQHKVILLLLEDYTAERVAKVIAQPEPYGFNLATSESAVARFRRRFARAEEKYIASLDDAAFQQLIANAHQSEDAFQSAAQRLIKTRLLNAANNPLVSADTIDALITSLTKLRKQSLAERKQLHAEKSK